MRAVSQHSRLADHEEGSVDGSDGRGMRASEQPNRLTCFVVVRSIWVPSNGFANASALVAAAIACAATWAVAPRWQLLCCSTGAWLLQWVIFRVARSAEERVHRMSADVRADRSTLPLVALSLPAAAISAAAWLVMWLCGAMLVLSCVVILSLARTVARTAL